MTEWKETQTNVTKGPPEGPKHTELIYSDDEKLGVVRDAMLQHTGDAGGVICPCCGSINKVYARGIHWKSGVWLCQLVRRYLGEQRWYQVQEFYDVRGGDYAKLRYWGLAELKATTDYDKRTSGMWRPTQQGIKFAQGTVKVPEKVLLYQGQFKGYPKDVKHISIHQVLNGAEGHFSWSETMAPVAGVGA